MFCFHDVRPSYFLHSLTDAIALTWRKNMQFLLSGGHCQIIFGNPPEPRNVCIGGNYTYRSLRALWWIRASTLRRFGHGLFAERQDRWGSTVYLRKVAFCRFPQVWSNPKLSQALKDVNAYHAQKRKKQNTTQIQEAKNIHQTQIASNNTKPHNRIKSTGEKKYNKMQMQNAKWNPHTKNAYQRCKQKNIKNNPYPLVI